MEVPADHDDPEDAENMQAAQILGNSPRRSPRIAAKNASASSTPTSEPEGDPASDFQPQKPNLNDEYRAHKGRSTPPEFRVPPHPFAPDAP